jgi:hypothetical protein
MRGGMRVRVSDEQRLGDLIAFLEDVGYQSHQIGANEVLVSPVPSSTRLEALRIDLDLHLRAWEAAHPGVTANEES